MTTTTKRTEVDRPMDRIHSRAAELMREAQARRFQERDDVAREPLERVAAELRRADPKLSQPAAFVEAMRRRPDLRREYAEARQLLRGR
jgi:hypothetical protein